MFKKRLNEYYKLFEESFQNDKNTSSILKNTSDKGFLRELAYLDFLKRHIPKNTEALLGGFVFDQEGNESRQFDVIVVGSTSPRFILPTFSESIGKAFACIDGCVAIISIKSQLNTPDLRNELDAFAALPNITPFNRVQKVGGIDKIDYDEMPLKVIFAFDGMSEQAYKDAINEYYKSHPQVPQNKRPNIIHVNSKILAIKTTKDEQYIRGSNEKLIKGQLACYDKSKAYQGFPYVINEIMNNARRLDFIILDYTAIHHLCLT